MTNLDII